MKLIISEKNFIILEIRDWYVAFSYKIPVAGYNHSTRKCLTSIKYHSKTTSKHTNRFWKFLGLYNDDLILELVDESEFDRLIQ